MNNEILQSQFRGQIPKPGKTGVDWYLFCYFLNLYKNSPTMEIGVGNGGSLYTMTAFSNDVTAIDSWDQNWPKSVVVDHLQTIQRSVKFIDSRSESLDRRQLAQYKFIHLDANKSYQGTLRDLELAENFCSGIICVDDYMNSIWPEVTWAVDEFIKRRPTWKKLLVGNHQIFLSNTKIDMKELIVDFPLTNRMDTWYLTYGKLPNNLAMFAKQGKMKYSWHELAWENNSELL